MKQIFVFSLLAVLLLAATTSLGGEVRRWQLDKAHSNIYFGVAHIFSEVRGHFNQFDATIVFEPGNLDQSRFEFDIEVDSIDTNIPKRDKHLASEDFFDARNFPEIRFVSTGIEAGSEGMYLVTGILTIKGVDYDLVLPLRLEGIVPHPTQEGTEVAGFNGTLKLDRLTYGVGTGKFYELGLVGKEVEVLVTLEVLSETR